jgi:hypothetical protein
MTEHPRARLSMTQQGAAQGLDRLAGQRVGARQQAATRAFDGRARDSRSGLHLTSEAYQFRSRGSHLENRDYAVPPFTRSSSVPLSSALGSM